MTVVRVAVAKPKEPRSYSIHDHWAPLRSSIWPNSVEQAMAIDQYLAVLGQPVAACSTIFVATDSPGTPPPDPLPSAAAESSTSFFYAPPGCWLAHFYGSPPPAPMRMAYPPEGIATTMSVAIEVPPALNTARARARAHSLAS